MTAAAAADHAYVTATIQEFRQLIDNPLLLSHEGGGREVKHFLQEHQDDIIDNIQRQHEDDGRTPPKVNAAIAIWKQGAEAARHPGITRELLLLFLKGILWATPCHMGPLFTEHAQECGGQLVRLVQEAPGLFTTDGQERTCQRTPHGALHLQQRAYLCAQFILQPGAQLEQLVRLMKAANCCFELVIQQHQQDWTFIRLLQPGADADTLQLNVWEGLDNQTWPGREDECFWVTRWHEGREDEQVENMTLYNHSNQYVDVDDIYGLATYGTLVSFDAWDPTWPESDERGYTCLEERLLHAIQAHPGIVTRM